VILKEKKLLKITKERNYLRIILKIYVIL